MLLFSLILVDQLGNHSKLDVISAGNGKVKYKFTNNKGKRVSPKSIGTSVLTYKRKTGESNLSLKNRLIRKIQISEKSLFKVTQSVQQGSLF